MNENYLIDFLKRENGIEGEIDLPADKQVRALMNVTMPYDLPAEFYSAQDEFLQERLRGIKVTDVNDLTPVCGKLYLYLGDVTALRADAIVNACNEKLLGCFQPLHGCIDNAIHSFAGLQMRRDLISVMAKQGHDEPNGRAKITKAYNLPSKYVLHTVGPIVRGAVTPSNEKDLYDCYVSCLKLADEYELESVAFCSISTGVYGYPIEKACKTAITAVCDYFDSVDSCVKKVVFNVFSQRDYDVYLAELKERGRV